MLPIQYFPLSSCPLLPYNSKIIHNFTVLQPVKHRLTSMIRTKHKKEQEIGRKEKKKKKKKRGAEYKVNIFAEGWF